MYYNKQKYLINIIFFLGVFLFSSIFCQKGWTQDPEFSQFFAAPSYMNPAMIGMTPGARVALNVRLQQPTFGNAFNTLAVSYDQYFGGFNSSLGLSIVGDRAGGLLNTYMINGLYAYNVDLGSEMLMKIGLQAGYLNKSIPWDELVFEDMIDANDGPQELPTGEQMPENLSLHHFDFGAGILLYSNNFYIGAAFKHLTRPSMSFYNDADPDNRLGVRTAVHIGNVFYIGDRPGARSNPFYISPNLLVVNQYLFFQINGGIYFGKDPVFAGLFYRNVINNSDALIALAGIKTGNLRIAYSYDFGIANINTYSSAHELSLVFDFAQNERLVRKGKARGPSVECPKILR